MESVIDSITQESLAYSWIECLAVFTAIIYVILAAKTNRWCFLFGFISSVIYVYLATSLKFYFDTAINAYYVIMSFYGWFAWSKESVNNKLSILRMSNMNLFYLILSGLLLSISLAFIVDNQSDASLPYIDAFTTVFAIIGTWLVVKKYIQNWLIWIAVDIVAAGMYFQKGLLLTSALFIVYTVISIIGYRKWKIMVE